jgi:hypothetical protein
MTNLTLSIDEELLKRARIHALENGSSLNAVVRDFLEQYAGNTSRYVQITDRLISKSQQSQASSEGQAWMRDELYER